MTAWTDCLLLIMSLFACTFFIYKDFGLRMLYGYAICGLIFAVHCLRRIIMKRPPHFNRIKAAYLVMIAVVFICFLRPDSRHDTDTVSYILAMLICSLYVLFSTPSDRELKAAMWVFSAAAVIFALYTLLFAFYPDFYWKVVFPHLSEDTQVMARYYVPRGYSIPVGGSYTFVDYIVSLALPFSLGILFSGFRKKWIPVISLVACYLYISAVIFIGRRGEMLAILGSVGLVILFSMNFRSGKAVFKRVIAGILLFATFGLLLTGFVLIGIAPRYKDTVEKVYANIQIEIREKEAQRPTPSVPAGPAKGDPSAEIPTEWADISSGRFELWETAWEQFKEHPVIGIGWGSFADYVSEEFSDEHARSSGAQAVVNVHNCYLQFLCETGIIGGILIMIPLFFLYFCSLVQVVRGAARRKSMSRLSFISSILSFGGQSFFLLVAVLDMPFYHYRFWAFYGALILFSYASLERDGFAAKKLIGRGFVRIAGFLNRLFAGKNVKTESLKTEDI
ncbi:MAG: O-antigen ligase family protein [Oscillospiraceae bacterium]|nr:O-antigen ligase family protein [Oscillospiraceae bacterium]